MKNTSSTRKARQDENMHCLSYDDGNTYIPSRGEVKHIGDNSHSVFASKTPLASMKDGHASTEAIACSRWGPPDKLNKDIGIESMVIRDLLKTGFEGSLYRLTQGVAALLKTFRLVTVDSWVNAHESKRVINKQRSSMDKRSVNKRERTRRISGHDDGFVPHLKRMTLTLSVRERVLMNKFCPWLDSTVRVLARQSLGRCTC